MDIGDVVKSAGQKVGSLTRKAILPLVLAGGLAYTAPEAKAQTIAINSITQDATYNNFNMYITNTTPGTSFTSFDIGKNFLTAVYNNSSLVDNSSMTFEQFVAQAAPVFSIDGLSEVSLGWNDSTTNSTGVTSLIHDAGDAGLDYDEWSNNSANDLMAGTYRVEKDAFKPNISYSTGAVDGSSIPLSFTQGSNPFGVAYASVDSFPSPSLTIYANGAAVPEPATNAVLAGLAALVLTGLRRKFKK